MKQNRKHCVFGNHLIISVWNHSNGECNPILQLVDRATSRVLVQWQNLFLQLINALFQQKQLARVQVDLHNVNEIYCS